MIEFRDVSKLYKQQLLALDQVSFRIEAGEFVFFIGESGAGKSTMIKLLTCEERPSQGTVILDQYDVSRMSRRLVPFLRRKIGMIFQDFRLIDSKTVYENVAFAMEIVGAPRRLIKLRVPIVLSVVGLKSKANAYPQELSGGEAQRVGIARAMVNNPRLILADEPTGNLDPANGEAIMALLDEINRAGTTVIACTHDLDTVERMDKRVIEIAHGKIVRDEYMIPKKMPTAGISCFLPSAEDQELLRATFAAESSERMDLPEEASPPLASDDVSDIENLREQMSRDQERRKNRIPLGERVARMRLEQERVEEPEAEKKGRQRGLRARKTGGAS